MSYTARNFKIGLFVLIGLIILVIGIIVFGGGKFFKEKYTIETYFEQSVQGLDVGAPLKLQGVQIGNVSEIHFVFNDYKTYKQYVLVRANVFTDSLRGGGGRRIADEYKDINVYLNELIENGLRLELSSQGITGVAFLNMMYVDPWKYPKFDIDWKPNYPYVPSSPGSITIITQSIENLTASLESIDFVKLSQDINILINTLTKTVEEAEVASISKDLRLLFGNINEITVSLNKALDNQKLQDSLYNFNKTMEYLHSASQNLPQTINNINKTVLNVKRLSQTQRENIEIILDNLRDISDDINEITETGKNYPSWLLFGNPPPEFKEIETK